MKRETKQDTRTRHERIQTKGRTIPEKCKKVTSDTRAIPNDKNIDMKNHQNLKAKSDNLTIWIWNVVPLVGRATSPSSFTTLTDVDSTVLAYETRL